MTWGVQSKGLTDGKWGSLSLILRQTDVPSPCVAGCWPVESQAAAEMKKLESSSGGELVIWCPAQEQSVMPNELRERGSLLQRPVLMDKGGENREQRQHYYIPCIFFQCGRKAIDRIFCWQICWKIWNTDEFVYKIQCPSKKMTQSTNRVPVKYMKHSHNEAIPSFLPGQGSVLQAVKSPLKATESLRWEEALPAEGSTMSKCQYRGAVINCQRWQPSSCGPAQLLPHDQTLRSGDVRQH